MMNILACLDSQYEGTYILDGIDISKLTENQLSEIRNKKIGFIFQDFNLIPKMTILENVSLPLVYAGVPKTKRLIKSSEMLSYINMQKREYYYPYQLSGGQKQRVAIARALVSAPEIILADEPTGNLDSHNAHLVMEELRRIHSKGNTIIMVTHNPNLTSYATRVIHMLDGRIATDIKTIADEDLPERIKVNFFKKSSEPIRETIDDLPQVEEISETQTIKVRPIQQVGAKNPEAFQSSILESNRLPIVPPDPSLTAAPAEAISIENNESKSPNLSYKYPTTSEISIADHETTQLAKTPVKTDSTSKKPDFPVVSSTSSDGSIRIVKKVTSIEELEKPYKKSKFKAKPAKTNKKQAKGRRK